jgi:DNA helicase II / ATP-dependent DNA helicase PcrA
MNIPDNPFTTPSLTLNLNEQQKQAVVIKNGVLLVCAGAGSGKTRVITSRIAHLISNFHVPAYSIVALTFTNKAASEMKERVHKFLSDSYNLPYIGTFHSYCLRLLKTNAHLLRSGQFSLIDDDDQEKIIKQLLARRNLQKKIAVKQVLAFISRLKNDGLTHAEREEFLEVDPIFKELYFAYEHEKTQSRCFDFDDLLIKTLELFQTNPEFKNRFQQNIRHILVDEYQDTNKVQHALLKAMTKDAQNNFALDSLCVVGDEDQSIYSWRGATVANIVNFNKDFPQAELITIEQNYRSVQPILQVANNIIKHNTYRNPKNLWSSREARDRVRVISCMSGYQEGEAVAQFLKLHEKQEALNNCAILYRSHFQSRALEEALIRQSIPYKIIGGIQFYDRLEIKDMLAYLRLVVNPYDRVAFTRVINCPTRGLGNKFEELFLSTWEKHPFLDFKGIAALLFDNQEIVGAKKQAVKQFLEIFESLSMHDKPHTAIDTIIQKTNYFAYLQDAFERQEADIKRDNVKELVNGIVYFEENNTEATVDIFLQEVALLQEHLQASKEELNCVRLMTLHAAKGLEFDTVMLTGLEENILPSGHSLYTPETIEEERRLLYVGVTRARERLLLSNTRYRYTWGQMTEQRPSRFLEELPDNLVQFFDCNQWQQKDFTLFFHNWLNHIPTKTITTQQEKQPEITHITPAVSKKNSKWKEFQKITHATFGFGIIEKVEEKAENKTYLTIRFGAMRKKLDAQFVQSL